MYKTKFNHHGKTMYVSCLDINEYSEALSLRIKSFDDDRLVDVPIGEYYEVEDIAQEKLYEEKYEKELEF